MLQTVPSKLRALPPRLPQADWDAVSRAALQLFAFGQQQAAQRGLLLVDTKYEFGKDAQGERRDGVGGGWRLPAGGNGGAAAALAEGPVGLQQRGS